MMESLFCKTKIMEKYTFKPGHEDAVIPFPWIKGGIVTSANCTDEIVETIKTKLPHLAHNFILASELEGYSVETKPAGEPKASGEGDEKLGIEDLKSMLEVLTVPKIKEYAEKNGVSIEGNPNKADLINQIIAVAEAQLAKTE